MDIVLWVVAGILAVLYLVSGIGKLITQREKMAAMMRPAAWVRDFRPGMLKAIGAAEILGALGLILPALLGIAPVLVPLAAVGLALLMTGAVIVRVGRLEYKYALLDLAYLALAAFVAWGRFGPEPHAAGTVSAVSISYLSPGRLGAMAAALLGLIGLTVAATALARPASRLGTDSGRLGALSALTVGLVGLALGGVVVLTSDSGIGTGNGRAGAYVALVVGMIAVVLAVLAMVRSRRPLRGGRPAHRGDPTRRSTGHPASGRSRP